MPPRNQNNDPQFSETFKPALVFGTPSLDEMLNQIFIKEQFETYDENFNQMFFANLDYGETPNNPDANSVYTIETYRPDVLPNVRQVIVKGKEDFAAHSYLFEPEMAVRGVAIVMLKEMPNDNQIYCNIRYMPYSTLRDIICASDSDQITVAIPSFNVAKLNVTLMPTNTEDVLFKTHKTSINLQNTTEEQVVAAKSALEFTAAQLVAHFTSLILEPITNEDVQSTNLNTTFSLGLPASTVVKQICMWTGIVCTVTAGAIATPIAITTYGLVSFGTAAAVLVDIAGISAVTVGIFTTREDIANANNGGANQPLLVNQPPPQAQPQPVQPQVVQPPQQQQVQNETGTRQSIDISVNP